MKRFSVYDQDFSEEVENDVEVFVVVKLIHEIRSNESNNSLSDLIG